MTTPHPDDLKGFLCTLSGGVSCLRQVAEAVRHDGGADQTWDALIFLADQFQRDIEHALDWQEAAQNAHVITTKGNGPRAVS